MEIDPDHQLNNQAYKKLRSFIDRTFPKDWFVAIDNGEIVADAATFNEVDAALNAAGRTSEHILVVQAGADYPEYTHFLGISIRPL